MGKNVLIISTSLRKGSNSESLAASFAEGAHSAGHEVEEISLIGKTVNFCKGCLACQKTNRCVIQDDGDVIAQKMLSADVLVFATPIYYYEMSGQLKTVLDRANPLFSSNYAFRDIYLLMTAADSDEEATAGAIKGVEGWIACFPKAKLSGTVFAGGVTDIGEIQGHAALQKAMDMGRSL